MDQHAEADATRGELPKEVCVGVSPDDASEENMIAAPDRPPSFWRRRPCKIAGQCVAEYALLEIAGGLLARNGDKHPARVVEDAGRYLAPAFAIAGSEEQFHRHAPHAGQALVVLEPIEGVAGEEPQGGGAAVLKNLDAIQACRHFRRTGLR